MTENKELKVFTLNSSVQKLTYQSKRKVVIENTVSNDVFSLSVVFLGKPNSNDAKCVEMIWPKRPFLASASFTLIQQFLNRASRPQSGWISISQTLGEVLNSQIGLTAKPLHFYSVIILRGLWVLPAMWWEEISFF